MNEGFQTGQRVICTDATNNAALEDGKEYVISNMIVKSGGAALQLDGLGDDRFFPYRFKIAAA